MAPVDDTDVLETLVIDEPEPQLPRGKSIYLNKFAVTPKRIIDVNSVEDTQPPEVSDNVEGDDDYDDIIDDHDKWHESDVVLPYLISFVVGMGNIWRFPYLCENFGGGAFIIPYMVMALMAVYPILYLELLVGQFAQIGSIAAFKFVPLFKGVGICMTILVMLSSFNIQSVLAWCLFYLFQSAFHSPLPWISCDNGFGKLPNGQDDSNHTKSTTEDYNWNTVNCTEFYVEAGSFSADRRLPGSEYFVGRVQRMWKSGFADREKSNYTGDNGAVRYGFGKGDIPELSYNADTMCALIAAFLLIQIFLLRGTKINGTIVALLVAIPYVILALLFYRSSGLNGAWQEGLLYYIKPNYAELANPETWGRAAEHVFRSSGAGLGVHLTIASHNRDSRNVLADATKLIIINIVTTLFSASVIFMLIGHVHVTVKNDIRMLQGPELVFEMMADVLGVLAKPNFYSSIFYAMLFFMGITSVTTSLVCAENAILEVLPARMKHKPRTRLLIVICISVLSFIQSSLNLTRGGLHLFHYIDTFIWSFAAIMSSILFLVGFVWFWGLEEIVWASIMMGQREPGIYFQVCWKYFILIVLLFLFVLGFDPDIHKVLVREETVEISSTLITIGYLLAFLPLSAVVIWAYHSISMQRGKSFKQNLLLSVSPLREHEEIRVTGTGKRASLSHYFYLYASTSENRCRLFCGADGAKSNQVQPYNPPSNVQAAKSDNKSTTSGSKSPNQIPIVLIDDAANPDNPTIPAIPAIPDIPDIPAIPDIPDIPDIAPNASQSSITSKKSATYPEEIMVHKRGTCCTIV